MNDFQEREIDYPCTGAIISRRSTDCYGNCTLLELGMVSKKSFIKQEECSLLGYKTSVRTSQETHYVSATQPSPLILCKI
jgi:hypothetical protein